MLSFRRMDVDADRETILAFYAGTHRDAKGTDLDFDEEEYLDRIRQKSAAFPDGYVLAIVDGQPVGHLELQVKVHEGRDIGYVSLIYLKSEYRGTGFSQQMFAYAEQFFRQLGMTEIHLRVDQENERAKRFYEKAGMQVVCAEPNSLGDPCYRMAKTLAESMNEGMQRVQDALRQRGFANEVRMLPNDCRTSQLAADALGCDVAQIAKSLVFRAKATGRPVLVIASGTNRVDEKRLEVLVGEKISKADADFVREQTGFVIGGVAPVGHVLEMLCFLDEDLRNYETLWAAAGHPKSVFSLTFDELVRLTNGQVASIRA